MKLIIFSCVICVVAAVGFVFTRSPDVNTSIPAAETQAISTVMSPAPLPTADSSANSSSNDLLIPEANAKLAPDLIVGKWINSSPLRASDLRGKVVLLDFWTFGCYNCVNTLPTLKRFDATYRSKGLTIIGIETPELDFEHSFDNLAAAVKKRGIEYPVLTDYDFANWNAFKVEAWPTVIILDKAGRIRYRHIGEGAYEMQENVIKTLLADADRNHPEL